MLLLLLVVLAQSAASDVPDGLYADRAHIESAQRAAEIWESKLAANPNDFESAWKLSRATYWLGGHMPKDAGQKQFERGIDAGKKASMLQPSKPEGYFWMAANMGALAVESVLKLIHGETLEPVIDTGTVLVTAENAADYQ